MAVWWQCDKSYIAHELVWAVECSLKLVPGLVSNTECCNLYAANLSIKIVFAFLSQNVRPNDSASGCRHAVLLNDTMVVPLC